MFEQKADNKMHKEHDNSIPVNICVKTNLYMLNN